jgi:hypothetical protein
MPRSPHGPRNWRVHSDPVENEERAIARHTPLSLLLDDPKVEVLSAENTKAPEVIIFRGLGWVAGGRFAFTATGHLDLCFVVVV